MKRSFRIARKLRSAAIPALCLIAALGVGTAYAADVTVTADNPNPITLNGTTNYT